MPTNLNPFDLRGTEFLFLYLALIAVAGIAIAFVRRLVDHSPADGAEPQLDRYETAYLVGGAGRVALLGVATIVDQTRAKIDGRRLTIDGRPDSRSHAVERVLLSASSASPSQSRQMLRSQTDDIRRTLQSAGLLVSDGGNGLYRGSTLLLTAGLLVIGVIKLLIGVNRHRPVGFLVFLCVAVLISSVILLKSDALRTRRGKMLVARLRNAIPRDPDVVRRGTLGGAALDERDAPAQMAAAMVALWGMDALSSHPDYTSLRRQFAGDCGESGAIFGDGGSSDGGGGSCGGGGGGCGGGGCGGCGGGS